MSQEQDRELQDWGGYEPEVQKALRFVATTSGMGTAKQVARAIDREYARRKSEQKQPIKKPLIRSKQVLSEDELKVLRIASSGASIGGFEMEQALHLSGLDEKTFYRCIDTLIAQRYLGGDAFIGFYRTKKPFPKPTEQEYEAAFEHIEDPFAQRVARIIHKAAPGWTL